MNTTIDNDVCDDKYGDGRHNYVKKKKKTDEEKDSYTHCMT